MDRLIEARHVTAADYRQISVPGGRQQEDNWLFLPQAAGGSIALPTTPATTDAPRQLHWHLQTHSTSTLSLAEVSLTRGQISRGLQLQIQDQVFPAVAAHVDASAQVLRLSLVLASKAVAVLTLPLAGGAAAAQGNNASSSGSILDQFGLGGGQQQRRADAAAGWHVVQCGPQLSALGLPSALAVADGHLCVAGSNGTTTCISMAVLASQALQELPTDSSSSSAAFSLDPTGLFSHVKRRVLGLTASIPAVAAVALDVPAASSLLVVHEDGSCYQWLVGQHRQGMYQQLTPAAQGKQPRPSRVCVCYPQALTGSRAPSWDALLVFDVGLPDRGAQSDIRVLPLRLQREQDQTVAASRLEPLLPQPKQLQLEWPDAALLDAKVVGQQLLVLCSTTSAGSIVVSYSAKSDWSYQGPCQLLQQKAGDWGGQQEVWSAALAAFPDDINPGAHVLSQLLVPGQLCGNSLREALSYFGGQLGQAELAECSLSQLQSCITAAVQLIQARNPGFSAARCWHMLFARYCEVWQQQHALLGLWASSGGWMGAVRAGGLLTVLRGVTHAEALAQEGNTGSPSALKQIITAAGMSSSSNSQGIVGGAADVAKLRVCLDTVGDTLGAPALRVMTQLVMAGVPVESRLLPAFVQLLLQGPPIQQQQQQQTGSKRAAAAFGGGDAGSSSRQQQLLAWRQQRQCRLLAVHAQLAELPHALETLTGFADLAIMAATHAAAQLQPPAPAAAGGGATAPPPPLATSSLLSSVALHSLRATCLTLQKLLLLLGYITHLGSLGSAPLTAADQAALAADLVAPVATALRSAAAALWLCKTPASAAVPGLLAGLRTNTGLPGPLPSLRAAAAPAAVADSAAAGAAVQQSGGAPPAVWRHSLAAHLLPSFWQQQGLAAAAAAAGAAAASSPLSGSALGQLAGQLAVWLMLGAETQETSDAAGPGVITAQAWFSITGRVRGSGHSAGHGVHAKSERALRSAQGLAGRAVLVGYRLFSAREYGAMQQLVRLVGGESPSEAGLQYILGLSIACSMHSSSSSSKGHSSSTGQARLDAAVGHLFRAAAGLCTSEAGPLRLVLQLVWQQLRSQQQGAAGAAGWLEGAAADGGDGDGAADSDADMADASADGGGGGAPAQQQQRQQQQEAMLRLRFDQVVMLLFEQRGVKEGALAFARAALSVVDAAYSSQGAQQQQEKLKQQAHLWSSIFNLASDLGLTEDAYTAALANPQHDTAEELVRRLVLAFVEQGQLRQLLSLPWAGVLHLKRDRLVEPVPVVEVVIDRLVSTACFSSQRGHALSAEPLSSYQVLYDFLVAWGNHKHAAAAMLALARRLRSTAAASSAAADGSGKQQKQLVARVVAEVQAAYDASIALLQLLDPTDAWIDPTQRLLQQYQAPAPRVGSGRRPAAAAAMGGEAGSSSPFMPSTQQQQRQAAGAGTGSANGNQQSGAQALQQQQRPRWQQQQQQQSSQALRPVLSLRAIQQEAAVFTAAAALQHKGSGLEVSALMGHSLDVGWLFDQLVGQGLAAQALQLAHAVYSGQQLLQQLEVAVTELAGQCADLQHGSASGGAGGQQADLGGGAADAGAQQQEEGFADSSMFDGSGGSSRAAGATLRGSLLTPLGPSYLCSEAATAWAKLRRLLEWYDAFDCLGPDAADAAGADATPASSSSITLVGARLRLAAVDGVLSTQPRMSLPAWLLQPFQPTGEAAGMAGSAADPAALLRTLMEHWRLVDAAQLVSAYLDAWRQRSSLQRVHSSAVWLPLADLELLHASLQDGARRARDKGAAAEAAVLGGCAEGLQDRLKQHVDLVKADWGQLQLASTG